MKKSHQLTSIIESIRSITSSLEINEVLDHIVTHAINVISAADAGYVQLYNEETKELFVKSAIGFNEKLQEIKIKIGESITGKVFITSKPVIYYSRSEIYEGMATISKQNLDYIEDASNHLKLKALISVPLIVKDNTIGVMTVQQYDAKGNLTEDDLQLLEGFAAQAAIAIHNARLFKEKNEQLAEIIKLTKTLEEKNNILIKRAKIHETLTRISLQNKSIESIIPELNRIMNREIFFYDNLDSQLYPKTTISYPYLSNEEFSAILRTKNRPFFIEIYEQREISYYIYPILSDRVSLGCIIIPLVTPIASQDKMTIEQASSILALELTKQKTQAEVYYKKTHEAFNDLVKCKDDYLLAEMGESLGIQTNSYFAVLLIEIISYSDLQILEAVIHRFISRMKRRLPEQGTLIFGFHNKITVLFSAKDPKEIDYMTEALDSLLFRWGNQEEITMQAGLSTTYQGIEFVSKCFDEAAKSLSFSINRQKTGIMNYKKMGINRLFMTLPSPEIERFIEDILGPLRTEKAQNNELEKTLFTYIKLNQSISETAETLHIHKNTLYHRIKKIEELLKLKLNNPDDYLQILLSRHLHENFTKR
ncbi:helix-turn-helix domain-containing protein [Neobacillus kokaensis]|uniref:GAF domain-containing protein n=1 Tax=Neobacillus kokaensis TaxID=2759023 RepID=A0ABQ3N883_9BACI|nr:helix-turn-helix domain-containing protein [Neobacillus kokaensis]GHI00214.1 hypothetical protein AM1BK_37560 [Neobacillus kokaensis]